MSDDKIILEGIEGIVAAVKKTWENPIVVSQAEPLSDEAAKIVVDRVCGVLYGRNFCRRKPADMASCQLVIWNSVKKGVIIPAQVGVAPLKNQKNCPDYNGVDWGELSMLLQLERLKDAIRLIYPPGISFELRADPSRTMHSNGVEESFTELYLESFDTLADRFGIKIVRDTDFYKAHSLDARIKKCEEGVRKWAEDPEGKEEFARSVDHALSNLTSTADTSQAREAAIRYLSALEAEKVVAREIEARKVEARKAKKDIVPEVEIWDLEKLTLRYSDHVDLTQMYASRKGDTYLPWGRRGSFVLEKGKVGPRASFHRITQDNLVGIFKTGLKDPFLDRVEVYAA